MLGGRSQNRLVRLALAISRARVDAATGRLADARNALNATIAEATSLGFKGYELAARLQLGEIEIARGDAAVGRAQLAALSKDAAYFFGTISKYRLFSLQMYSSSSVSA